MRQKSILRIEAPVHGDGVELRELRAMRFDPGQLVGRNVVFHKQRLVSGVRGNALDTGVEFLRIEMETVGDQVNVGKEIAMLVAQHEHGERRIVIDDDPSFAIEDFAARREDRNLLDTILFGERRVVVVARDLEAPQTEREDEEYPEDDVLHNRQPERRYFFLSAKHWGGSYSHSMRQRLRMSSDLLGQGGIRWLYSTPYTQVMAVSEVP